MPKIVDHEQRRAEIVSATWRLIARKGIGATTMRQIATEAGFANGALRHYFANKDDLLFRAYRHVFDATNERFASNANGLTGLAALDALCAEIMPLDEERRLEARIVIPFFEHAINDPAYATLLQDTMDEWVTQFTTHLTQAVQDGDLRTDLDATTTAEALLALLQGMQITAVLIPEHAAPSQLQTQYRAFLQGISA